MCLPLKDSLLSNLAMRITAQTLKLDISSLRFTHDCLTEPMTVPGGDSIFTTIAQQSALAHQQQPAQHLNSLVTLITSCLSIYQLQVSHTFGTALWAGLMKHKSLSLLH